MNKISLITKITKNFGFPPFLLTHSHIWKSEANLELTKRITLMDFQFRRSVQGNYTVKKFYSKLKECNMRIGYPEEHLKWLFLRGLSPENTIKVLMDGLQVLALDE